MAVNARVWSQRGRLYIYGFSVEERHHKIKLDLLSVLHTFVHSLVKDDCSQPIKRHTLLYANAFTGLGKSQLDKCRALLFIIRTLLP